MANDMRETTLIFGPDAQYLGEIVTKGGAFVQAILAPEGESMLGDALKEWQSLGVPTLREATREEKEGTTFFLYEDRALARDADFLDALRGWAEDAGLRTLTVASDDLHVWELLLRLPLTPVERHSMMYAAIRLSGPERVAWVSALTRACAAAERA